VLTDTAASTRTSVDSEFVEVVGDACPGERSHVSAPRLGDHEGILTGAFLDRHDDRAFRELGLHEPDDVRVTQGRLRVLCEDRTTERAVAGNPVR